MSDTPSQNPLVQRLQVLLPGGGYNFYDKANLARADDLLVRQRAGSFLTEAAQHLRAMETEYRQAYLLAATREQPFPPAEAMEKLRGLIRLAERLRGLESDTRGMAAPAQDKFWRRLRSEVSLLNALIAFDDALVQQSVEIERVASAWTAEKGRPRPWPLASRRPFSSLRTLFATAKGSCSSLCRGEPCVRPYLAL